jgi:nickel/cobalt transporter (NicO) family protein
VRFIVVAISLAAAMMMYPEPLSAQSNPFFGNSDGPEEEAPEGGRSGFGESAEELGGEPDASSRPASDDLVLDTAAEFSPPRTAAGVWLRNAQRGLTRNLSTTLRAVRRGEATGTFWLIVSLAFIYGVIHSILPGHRKVLLISYFLARDARPITGVVAGIALALVHAAAAVIVVLAAYYVVSTSISATVVRAGAAVQSVTAVLVLVAGIVLLVLTIREIRSHGHGNGDAHSHGVVHSHSHGHHPAHGHGDAHHHVDDAGTHARDPGRSQRLLPVIIISGLVPCPGSSMIMLFAVSVGVVTLGLIAVGSFAVGMAIVFSAICVTTILVKERINKLLESRRGQTLHHAIEIGGALVMVLFGLFLIAPVFL